MSGRVASTGSTALYTKAEELLTTSDLQIQRAATA
jgi:hypothetical protein